MSRTIADELVSYIGSVNANIEPVDAKMLGKPVLKVIPGSDPDVRCGSIYFVELRIGNGILETDSKGQITKVSFPLSLKVSRRFWSLEDLEFGVLKDYQALTKLLQDRIDCLETLLRGLI